MNQTDSEQSVNPDGPTEPDASSRPGYAMAAERILEFIAEHSLEPGERLPTEAELGNQIGFSRAVTREAIKVLSALGRVSAHRGRGVFVAHSGTLFTSDLAQHYMPTHLDDITKLFEFRRTQEAELARLAATRGAPAAVRAVEEAAARSRNAMVNGSKQEKIDGDLDFHRAVAAAAHNDLLSAAREAAAALQRQSAVIGLTDDLGDIHAAADEHDAIARAIRRGEPEEAESAAKAHMDRTYADYYKVIQQGLLIGPRGAAESVESVGPAG